MCKSSEMVKDNARQAFKYMDSVKRALPLCCSDKEVVGRSPGLRVLNNPLSLPSFPVTINMRNYLVAYSCGGSVGF